VLVVPADVSVAADAQNLISKVGAEFKQIDILVNNAGGPPFAAFETFDDEQWQKAFELNLLSFARLSRLTLPYMKPTGSGRIINIISGSVKSVLANSVLSTSMRMGIVGMAKMMADELGPYNITVNNVAPGLILTDRIKHTLPPNQDPDEALKQRATNIPLRRIGDPKELAALVAFLASEQASYISGTTIPVDGGASRSIY
jgi:3-oxoacyl-[acyl-carrier protein] reductase